MNSLYFMHSTVCEVEPDNFLLVRSYLLLNCKCVNISVFYGINFLKEILSYLILSYLSVYQQVILVCTYQQVKSVCIYQQVILVCAYQQVILVCAYQQVIFVCYY